MIANRSQRIAAEQRKIEKQNELNRHLAGRLGEVTLTFKAKVGSKAVSMPHYEPGYCYGPTGC